MFGYKYLMYQLRFLARNAGEKGQILLVWENVMRGIMSNWANNVTRKQLRRMCPLLIDALRTGSCADRVMALEISVICACHLRQTLDFQHEASYRTLRKRNYTQVYSVAHVLPEDIFRRCICFWENSTELSSYKEVKAYEFLPSAEETSWIALNAGEWELLDVLVRYGFFNGLMDTEDHLAMTDFKLLWMCLRKHYRVSELVVQRIDQHRNEGIATWENLRTYGSMVYGDHSRGFRRAFLVVRMLKLLSLKPKDQREYVRCLRTYFAVLPDPFVSPEEVREFLQYLLILGSGRWLVDRMVDMFEEHFGKKLYGPRSLEHQSRLAVRKSLLQNKSATLPKLVEALKLPIPSKDLILGAPDNDSF